MDESCLCVDADARKTGQDEGIDDDKATAAVGGLNIYGQAAQVCRIIITPLCPVMGGAADRAADPERDPRQVTCRIQPGKEPPAHLLEPVSAAQTPALKFPGFKVL